MFKIYVHIDKYTISDNNLDHEKKRTECGHQILWPGQANVWMAPDRNVFQSSIRSKFVKTEKKKKIFIYEKRFSDGPFSRPPCKTGRMLRALLVCFAVASSYFLFFIFCLFHYFSMFYVGLHFIRLPATFCANRILIRGREGPQRHKACNHGLSMVWWDGHRTHLGIACKRVDAMQDIFEMSICVFFFVLQMYLLM